MLGQPESRSPFNKDRHVVPDGAVIEEAVFFGDHVFDDGALFLGEALRQPVDNSHEGPHFGFVCHPQSFNPAGRRVNHHLVVPRSSLMGSAGAAGRQEGVAAALAGSGHSSSRFGYVRL